jgi:hypothetical protein
MASADVLTISSSSSNFPHLDHSSSALLKPLVSSKRKRASDNPFLDLIIMESPKKLIFSPERHLAFTSPPKTFTMKDLGLPEDLGVSPVAVSEPFQLFTPEAIKQMRAEVLSTKVWENCQYSSNLSQCQLRGFAPE